MLTRPQPSRTGRRLLLAALAAVAALLTLALPAIAAPTTVAVATASAPATPVFADPPPQLGHCHNLTVPVTLPGGQAAHLAGHLCTPTHGHPDTVLMLAHGATYNSGYWSWSMDPDFYSFVWQTLRSGYAVLAIDRLGDGQSSRPESTMVTFPAEASTLHQAVTALRAGTVGHTRWERVILVGHSYGSAEIAQELATYPGDADAVILTGSGHAVSANTQGLTQTGFKAASTMLARFGELDAQYLTSTTQQVRDELLYRDADSDPAVRAFDQATRDTLALAEATTRPPDLSVLTRTLRIPTLLIDGQFDSHYCNGAQVPAESTLDNCSSSAALYASEKPQYGSCFAAAIVPGSGHDLMTEYGARVAAGLILRFARATVPPSGGRARCAVLGAFPAHSGDDRGAGESS
jgi:pimeloyl-ACP methyl ester carboxylesterase